MVKETFSGPAIDGPLKGRIVTSESPHYRIIEPADPEELTLRPMSSVVREIRLRYGFYEYEFETRHWRWKGWL